jgi:predicted ATPase/class 3 adenylate cyclase
MSAPLTFLFTDLENSTSLWERAPDAMRAALAQHDALMHKVIESHHGHVVKDTGDGVMAVFESPLEAIRAALECQQTVSAAKWPEATGPIRVRMGLHTGESQERDGDYYGQTLNRASRVMGIGHGGQVLVSQSTWSLLAGQLPEDASLSDLGEHRLKGIPATVQIYQLRHPDLVADFPPLTSLSTLKHNLPAQLSSFVGREQELADVQQRLASTRLLTLLGPGGMGKTRLMLRVAEEVVDQYADGVWLVELAPVTDPSTIAERIAAALNVQQQPGRPMADTLVDFLRHKEVLLLADNVEHLVGDTAQLAEQLLGSCPQLTVLVTSREALLIGGETTFQIPTLSLPNPEMDSGSVADTEAVRLFLERAQAVRPEFGVSAENSAAVAEIVRRLDGIPLALELAAARLRMLSVEQIEARLSDRFRLLSGGRRTAVPRQQTLEATIDWSWDLLNAEERLLLERLSVFRGGWSVEGAQAVASDGRLDKYEVFDNLEHLVDKSLVTVAFDAAGRARHGMLESVRHYATERLAEAGTGEALRQRHAEYYTAFAEEASPHLVRSDMLPWVDKIVQELDNLRAIMAWTLENQPALALKAAGALLEREAHWLTPREAASWLQPAIVLARDLMKDDQIGIPQKELLRVVMAMGVVQAIMGEATTAAQTFDECIEFGSRAGELRLVAYAVAVKTLQVRFAMPQGWIGEVEDNISVCRDRGYDVELAWLLAVAGFALSAGENAEDALPYWRESVEVFADVDNPYSNLIANRMRMLLAEIHGDVAEAGRQGLAWVESARTLGARRSTAQGLSELGHLLRRAGELGAAEGHYREAIVSWQELGQLPAVAHQLECLSYIAITKGEHSRAAELLGAAGEARRQIHAPSSDPGEIAELTQAMEQVESAIGENDRDNAIAAGKLMTLDDAVNLAVGGSQ